MLSMRIGRGTWCGTRGVLVVCSAGLLTAGCGSEGPVLPPLDELERRFTERMRDVALVGQFTVVGRENQTPRPERYEIESVEKVGEDRWQFNARLQYASVDVTLPIRVTMLWAGDTPMVSLTDLSIPTLGTFSSRVLFYEDRYAGTWQHGDTGGHLYGLIEPMQPAR